MCEVSILNQSKMFVLLACTILSSMTELLYLISEAVMKPHFWPLSSLEMMCWGQLVVFRCWSERGTDVQYTWFRVGKPNNIVLHNSTDLHLHCSNITEDSQLFCLASNDVSSQSSEFISLQILQPADKNCVNLISSKGELNLYIDCILRFYYIGITLRNS